MSSTYSTQNYGSLDGIVSEGEDEVTYLGLEEEEEEDFMSQVLLIIYLSIFYAFLIARMLPSTHPSLHSGVRK